MADDPEKKPLRARQKNRQGAARETALKSAMQPSLCRFFELLRFTLVMASSRLSVTRSAQTDSLVLASPSPLGRSAVPSSQSPDHPRL